MEYIEEQIFENKNYSEIPLELGEYEGCRFLNCNFSNANLSDMKFIECEFVECNLSNSKLNNTSLQDVKFEHCKMLGLQFEGCNEFGFSCGFSGCTLNHSSFYQNKIRKTRFSASQLHEVDFTESDLSEAIFDDCDLTRAIFDRTNLVKADFKSSYNYSIDPENNRMKKAIFSQAGLVGLLLKYQIDVVK